MCVSRTGIFKCNCFGFWWVVCLFALVKADFTTGLIAYIWIYAMLNTVCFGDLSEASA